MSRIKDMALEVAQGKLKHAETLEALWKRTELVSHVNIDQLKLSADELDEIRIALVFYADAMRRQGIAMEDALEAGSEDGDLRSHSEEQILDGCISLMYELFGRFTEYLEWIGFEPENEEEVFETNFSYGEIVSRLFLWNTHHSGGTSTAAKCRILGKDYSENVRFDAGEAGEEEEEE